MKNKIAIYSPVFAEKYLDEFIDYYTKIGVELFIFYDDSSSNEIKLYERTNIIVIPQDNNIVNTQFFRHCYKILVENNISHILKVDCDEFLYLNEFKNIDNLIESFEPFDCLKINWLMFGSNKMLKNETNGILNTFQYSNKYIHDTYKCLTKISSINYHDKTNYYTHPHILPLRKNSIVKNILNNVCEIKTDDIILETFKIEKINLKYNNNIYLAHYSHQDLYTFLKKKFSVCHFCFYWEKICSMMNCDYQTNKIIIDKLLVEIQNNFEGFFEYMCNIYNKQMDKNKYLDESFKIKNFPYEKQIIIYFDSLDNDTTINYDIINSYK